MMERKSIKQMIPKIFFFVFFISVAFTSQGQDVVITNSFLNILYVGIDNPIEFASKTIPKKQIILSTKTGEILYWGEHYSYRNCTDKLGVVVIYARNAKTKKLIDSVEFRLKRLPDPMLRIVTQNMDWDVYKGTDLLKDIIGFRCFYSNEFTDQNCRIIGFTITISDTLGIQKDIPIDGYMIPALVKTELAQVAASSAVTVHDFKITVGCVKETRLASNSFKLK